jgi:hypothetical protein
MTILPREQVTQRHPRAAVSAPGVLLWSSQTDLALCDVDVVDEVDEGEVELAQESAPYYEWTVVSEDLWEDVDDHPGVYQFGALGEGVLGGGTLGGVETDWYVEHGPSYWAEGYDEDGVYP